MNIENNNLNIPNVSVSELVDQLSALYKSAIDSNISFRDLPSPFFWGLAGIGKSAGVLQLADRITADTGRRAVVTDVRLLLFSPVDLRGVPVADESRRFTDWLMPRIFDMEEGDGVVNILFLDELSAAPQSVQAAAYQITLDRRIGEHKLPENCIVIAAGNRTTDRSVAYKMPKALCNRLMHFNVQSDYKSWKSWAVANGIDPRIIGFLGFDATRLCAEPESSDLAYPTPRSWSFVNSVIRTMKAEEVKNCHQMICACVGTDSAVAFEAWCDVCSSLPSTDDIIRGVCRDYPRTQDALYALSASLVESIRKKGAKIRLDELENVCTYASHFPPDFAMTFFKDVNSLPGARMMLMKCRAMQEWLTKNRDRL